MQLRMSAFIPENTFRDLFDVTVIDARDDHRIDFNDHAVLLELTDPFQLLLKNDTGGVNATVHFPIDSRPGVDRAPHFGIDCVDGHRHMADLQSGEVSHMA